MNIKRHCGILAVALCLAGKSQAVPITIDFSSALWSGSGGAAVAMQSYGALDLTLTATGGLLAFGSGGVGIGDDEIGDGQTLQIQFDSAVTLLGFEILNLYPGPGPGNSKSDKFAVAFEDYPTLVGHALGVHPNGSYPVDGLNLAGVQAMLFYPIGGSWSDFSLASLRIDAPDALLAPDAPITIGVTEPGALSLFALSFGLLGGWRIIRGRSLVPEL